jgi:hypothetical protein
MLTVETFKKQFLCRCGRCQSLPPSEKLLKALTAFLSALKVRGVEVSKCSSGYRCPFHNDAVGGAKGSMHMKGIACDLHVPVDEVTLQTARCIFRGVVLYDWGLHLDVRDGKPVFEDRR